MTVWMFFFAWCFNDTHTWSWTMTKHQYWQSPICLFQYFNKNKYHVHAEGRHMGLEIAVCHACLVLCSKCSNKIKNNGKFPKHKFHFRNKTYGCDIPNSVLKFWCWEFWNPPCTAYHMRHRIIAAWATWRVGSIVNFPLNARHIYQWTRIFLTPPSQCSPLISPTCCSQGTGGTQKW